MICKLYAIIAIIAINAIKRYYNDTVFYEVCLHGANSELEDDKIQLFLHSADLCMFVNVFLLATYIMLGKVKH